MTHFPDKEYKNRYLLVEKHGRTPIQPLSKMVCCRYKMGPLNPAIYENPVYELSDVKAQIGHYLGLPEKVSNRLFIQLFISCFLA